MPLRGGKGRDLCKEGTEETSNMDTAKFRAAGRCWHAFSGAARSAGSDNSKKKKPPFREAVTVLSVPPPVGDEQRAAEDQEEDGHRRTMSSTSSKIFTLKWLCSVWVASSMAALVLEVVLDTPLSAADKTAEAASLSPRAARASASAWPPWLPAGVGLALHLLAVHRPRQILRQQIGGAPHAGA